MNWLKKNFYTSAKVNNNIVHFKISDKEELITLFETFIEVHDEKCIEKLVSFINGWAFDNGGIYALAYRYLVDLTKIETDGKTKLDVTNSIIQQLKVELGE